MAAITYVFFSHDLISVFKWFIYSIHLVIFRSPKFQLFTNDDDTIVTKHVVNLKVEIIKAYSVVCMTEVLKSN